MTTTPENDPFAPRPESSMSPAPPEGQGPPPGYGAPQGYGAPPGYGYGQQAQPRNGTGTAALVLGILGLVLFFVPFLGLILAVVALVLGIVARKKVARNEATNA